MRYKLFLRWLACFAVSFLVVYMLGFATGHKLFEGGNVALIEASISLILATVVFHYTEESRANKAKIKEVEEQIAKLEDKK